MKKGLFSLFLLSTTALVHAQDKQPLKQQMDKAARITLTIEVQRTPESDKYAWQQLVQHAQMVGQAFDNSIASNKPGEPFLDAAHQFTSAAYQLSGANTKIEGKISLDAVSDKPE